MGLPTLEAVTENGKGVSEGKWHLGHDYKPSQI